MRIPRFTRNPVVLLAVATVLVVAVVERSVGQVLLGLVGAVIGLLVGLLSLQVGMLLGAVALGVRVHTVVIGVGRRLRDWTGPRRAVVVRAVPLFLSVSVAPGKAPARRRMWGAALCSAVVGTAAAGAAVVGAALVGGGLWTGLSLACALTVGHALVPRKTPGSTSTGWFLLRLPGLTGVQAQQLDAAPLVGQAVDAAQRGDLALAAELAARLREQHPTLRTATAGILVLQAGGRYAEAMQLAMGLIEGGAATPGEAAPFFAALADLACATVEAGQLDPELGLRTAEHAIEAAETLGYPKYKLAGPRALHRLLRGDVEQAIVLARSAARSGDDRLGRADDLATLALAHMAAGDNAAAREAIVEAEKLVPWWPRVARTRARLDVG